MEDPTPSDRIERDAEEIARAAADAREQRETELGAGSKVKSIEAEIAKLAHERDEAAATRDKAHEAIVQDEHRIADADRDMRDALGNGQGTGGPSNPPSGGHPGGPPSQSPGHSPNPPLPSSPPPHRPVG